MTLENEEETSNIHILEQDFDDMPTELYSCIGDGNWEKAAEIAMENPEQVKTWVVRYHKKEEGSTSGEKKVMWRFLPLHSACARQPSDELIELLLFIYPEAAIMKDRKGMLPLHYACGNHSSYSVINMLLIAHPQGAEDRDVYGKLPIHHACQWGASSPWVVGMLLTVYPESVFELDNNENTPLDLAKAGKYEDKASIITTLARCASAAAIRAESAAVRAETLEKNAEEINTLESELDAFKKDKSKLAEELNTYRVTSKKAMEDDSEKIQSLEAELVTAQKEYDNIKRELDDTFEERSSTKLEADRLKEKCAKVKNELEGVQKERDHLREKVLNEINRSREVIDGLEVTVAEGVTEMKSLITQESSLLNKIEDLKKERNNIMLMQQEYASEVESLIKYKKKAEGGRKVLNDFAAAIEPLVSKQKELIEASTEHVERIKKINTKRDRQLLEIALSEETRRFDTTENYNNLKKAVESQEKGLEVVVEAIKACGSVEGKNFSPEQPLSPEEPS